MKLVIGQASEGSGVENAFTFIEIEEDVKKRAKAITGRVLPVNDERRSEEKGVNMRV